MEPKLTTEMEHELSNNRGEDDVPAAAEQAGADPIDEEGQVE